MDNKNYPSDLTNEQWKLIEPLLPPAKTGGRPRSTDLRQVINGILYLVRTGCSWRMLPRDFPPWPTVHDYYRKYRHDGTWNQIHEALHEQVRIHVGREPCPSAAIIDSQSVKTASKGGIKATTRERRYRVENAIWW
jgi:putative transposase